jgi:peptidyl-prolyl cis-trans isomerase SurA
LDTAGKVEQNHLEDFQMPVYVNDIAAIVNDEIVTMGQLMREVAPLIPRIRFESRTQEEFQRKVLECQRLVLDAFIERILIVSDFKAKGGRIPESYEKNEYEAYIYEKFDGDRIAFTKYLRDSGMSMREFKKNIREHAIVGFVMRDLQKSKAEVSPEKIKEYYNEHMSDFIFDRKIFVTKIDIPIGEKDDDELQATLAQLVAAVESAYQNECLQADDPTAHDANWERVRNRLKNFYGNRTLSDIGWVCVNEMIPAFANAASSIGAGEFSDQIAFDDKICALFVSSEKPAKKLTLDEVSGDIEKKLSVKYQMDLKANFVNSLRGKAYIKIFL